MPITLNSVTGLLDATIVDGNFEELEQFLKEGVTTNDFSGVFDKYKVRRYTSGKLVGFNSGSKQYTSSRPTAKSGTFENNWIAGTKSHTYLDQSGLSLEKLASQSDGISAADHRKNSMDYDEPLEHPFELLGYPGGSLFYDFQEQGFADPVSYYSSKSWGSVSSWPPTKSPLGRFPKDECWSRWLTVPDAAGGVYVDEPCVAVITAQVKGNYFFTPAMRVHGTNTGAIGQFEDYDMDGDGTDDLDAFRQYGTWKFPDGVMQEGMEHSAMLRLGLFVDTNPIVWEDEFFNGNDFGNVSTQSGHGFNPWIGTNPTGEFLVTRPDGVAKSRSWKKLTDLTYRVRQRGSYKVIGVVELKGRRRYNFSLKFRPAMTFGHVAQDGSDFIFANNYHEISDNAITKDPPGHPVSSPDGDANPAWDWSWFTTKFTGVTGPPGTQSSQESYFYPGGDALVTNLIESSSLSVEFFYGQTLTSLQSEASTFNPNEDPE